jgi:hypothetical protein
MTLVTSANNIGSDTEFIPRERSFMYIMYNRGPRIDPWGNPCLKVSCWITKWYIYTYNLFPYRIISRLDVNFIFYSLYILYALFLYILTYILIFMFAPCINSIKNTFFFQWTGWERTAVRSQPVHWMAAYREWRHQTL